MSTLRTIYNIRYSIESIREQIEAAAVTAAEAIVNEDPATPDHAHRLAWAQWTNKSSSVAVIAFQWPVAMNPTIQAAVAADPSGQSVQDSDIEFVVNSVLPQVVADFVANPPPGVTIPPA